LSLSHLWTLFLPKAARISLLTPADPWAAVVQLEKSRRLLLVRLPIPATALSSTISTFILHNFGARAEMLENFDQKQMGKFSLHALSIPKTY
jgi:hypothetical protein